MESDDIWCREIIYRYITCNRASRTARVSWLLGLQCCINCNMVFNVMPKQVSSNLSMFQKQLSRGVPRKRCSENMQQIYRRTPMPKCDFNKEVTLRHGCSPANLLHIFRTLFPRNTSGWLLLMFSSMQ